jgi:hypothetical protein
MSHSIDASICEFNIIPFAESISDKPICTFVKTESEPDEKYSFTDYEITMSLKMFNTYVKYFNFSNKKIRALKLARRRYKHCIYSRKYRTKRKNSNESIESNESNVSKDSIDDIPNLIYIAY